MRLPPYRGYDPSVNPSLTNEFATVGYRVHSMIHGEFEIGSKTISLNDAFFNPDLVPKLGLGPVLKGLSEESQYKNDEQIDNALRSTLFEIPSPKLQGVVDLGAIDVQRGRDHGIPPYNALRKALGLRPKRSFTAITGERSERMRQSIDDPHILDFTDLRDAFGKRIAPGSDEAEDDVRRATRRTTLAARLEGDLRQPGSRRRVRRHGRRAARAAAPRWASSSSRCGGASSPRCATATASSTRSDPALEQIRRRYGIDYRVTLTELIERDSDARGLPANAFFAPVAGLDTCPATTTEPARSTARTVAAGSSRSTTTARPPGCAATPTTRSPAAPSARRSTPTSTTRARPTVSSTRSAAAAPRAAAASSGSTGTRPSRRSRNDSAPRSRRTAARRSGPISGTGGLGQIQGSEGPAGARLWNVIGASLHYSNICAAAGSAGSDYVTAGNPDTDPEEFALARTVIFWGSNPLSTNHHIWKFVKDAHKVVVDPVQTRTARAADEHIALKPGTDAALALGLMAEIVALGGHDERFLAERASGWPGFRERLAGWSGERAAAICDVPYETIRALAERIATDGPTAIRASMGMQRHAGGGNAMRAVAALPVVTGDWGRPGGGFLYGTSYFTGNRFGVNRPDLRTGPRRALPATRLADTLLEEDDPPVTALFVYGANPAASNPDSAKVRRALSRDDLFTVVVEHFQTDTADYADIVLPSTMQIEQLDVNDGYGHAYLNLNRPAVAPAGECLPHTEIFRRIAAAMGLEEPALYASDEELVDTLLDGFAGRAEMEANGLGAARGPGVERALRAVVRARAERRARPAAGLRPERRGRGRARPDRGRVALVRQHELREPRAAPEPRRRADRPAPPRRRGRARAGRRRARADSQRARVVHGAARGERRHAARRRRDDQGLVAEADRRRERERDDRRARRRHGPRRGVPRQRGESRGALVHIWGRCRLMHA